MQIIPLRIIGPAIWCETHFDLNEAPNHEWLKQLSEELDIRWNPAHPQHLQGRFGFELKFEGNLMAMVCETFNLERYMKKLGTAVSKATKSFPQDGQRFSRLKEMIAARDAEILETHLLQSGESEEELIDGVLKWDEEDADRLTKKFHAIALS